MSERALVSFWAATAASALLLGSTWTLKDQAGQPGFGLWHVALLSVAAIGFCVTFLIAARIAFVAGRIGELWRAERRLGGRSAPHGSGDPSQRSSSSSHGGYSLGPEGDGSFAPSVGARTHVSDRGREVQKP